ncbi:hypothetical protein ACIBBE_46640 [Streptomyces sp. NPDC051644]
MTRRRPERRCPVSGIRLCSLCGAAAELDPVLKGFGCSFGEP